MVSLRFMLNAPVAATSVTGTSSSCFGWLAPQVFVKMLTSRVPFPAVSGAASRVRRFQSEHNGGSTEAAAARRRAEADRFKVP